MFHRKNLYLAAKLVATTSTNRSGRKRKQKNSIEKGIKSKSAPGNLTPHANTRSLVGGNRRVQKCKKLLQYKKNGNEKVDGMFH